MLERLLDHGPGDALDAVAVRFGGGHRQLDGVEGDAGVTATARGEGGDGFVVHRQLLLPQAALFVGEGAPDDGLHLLGRQRLRV